MATFVTSPSFFLSFFQTICHSVQNEAVFRLFDTFLLLRLRIALRSVVLNFGFGQ